MRIWVIIGTIVLPVSISVTAMGKWINTSYSESEIQIPATVRAVLIAPGTRPIIVAKRENMVDGIEEAIVSLYTKGISVADIEDQIRDVYNFEYRISTSSGISFRIVEDIVG